ncbi:hypothetical protein ACLIYP_00090 [Streptomyces nanhaiensis]|uniref:hypothetical protein n=1 Tax=Streptomyces nanhaiensis TaxID=679319 RepID=UPI00399D44C5
MNTGRNSRAGTRHTVRPAALGYALVTLLAALFMCLGTVAHHDGGLPLTIGTSDQSTTVTTGHGTDPTAGQSPTTLSREDCPSGTTCCGPAAHRSAAVLSVPAPSGPTIAPCLPQTAAVTGSSPPFSRPAGYHAPDLHVLQVQRI